MKTLAAYAVALFMMAAIYTIALAIIGSAVLAFFFTAIVSSLVGRFGRTTS